MQKSWDNLLVIPIFFRTFASKLKYIDYGKDKNKGFVSRTH